MRSNLLYYTIMLPLSQMLVRFGIALALGALMGLERESAGKEAGIRTAMLVSGGAALFTIIGISLPYLIVSAGEPVASGAALNVIANIVVGIGFLGGGIIIKTQEHVHGLTTAAVVWIVAAIGILAGLGLSEFATAAAVLSAGFLFIFRKLGIYEFIKPEGAPSAEERR